jgi:hypothetical protein
MMVAQFTAYAGQAFILVAGEEMVAVFLGTRVHTAEFVDVEGFPVQSNAHLLVDGWSAVFPLNCNKAIKEKRGEYNQTDGSQQAIYQSF